MLPKFPWLMAMLVISFMELPVSTEGAQIPAVGGQGNRNPLKHRMVLDDAFVISWTPGIDGFELEMMVQTQGWVGIGFSQSGQMTGSDIVMAWVDQTDTVHLSDRYAHGEYLPSKDASQDYKLLMGYRTHSHTVIRFYRPWITCDSENDVHVTNDTMRVIWAYNTDGPLKNGDSDLYRHTERGVMSIFMVEPVTVTPPSSADVKTWELRSKNISLPENHDTLYWCAIHEIPRTTGKTQIIGFTPLIEKDNKNHIHHVLIYECRLENSKRILGPWVGMPGHQCYVANMPDSWSSCTTPLVAWAIGSEGEILPDNVGFPLGEEYGGSNYILMEIHYDNPKLKKGVIDQSGIKIYYTTVPRKVDAAILAVGHSVTPVHLIPPNVEAWESLGHCTSACTNATFPKEGIKIFSGLLHQHLVGRRINLLQSMGEHEDQPPIVLFEDNNYDFNYQQTRIPVNEFTIKRGDRLTVKCTTNTTGRYRPTFGGFGTQEEMCLVYISYYPKIDISVCASSPSMEEMLKVLNIEIENTTSIKNMMTALVIPGGGGIDEVKERAILNKQETLKDPGKEVMDSEFAQLFNAFKLTDGSGTLYNALTRNELWEDPSVRSALQEVLRSGTYEEGCYDTKRKPIPLKENYGKSPLNNLVENNVAPKCLSPNSATNDNNNNIFIFNFQGQHGQRPGDQQHPNINLFANQMLDLIANIFYI